MAGVSQIVIGRARRCLFCERHILPTVTAFLAYDSKPHDDEDEAGCDRLGSASGGFTVMIQTWTGRRPSVIMYY
jgi:hypothetical protein